MVLHGRGPGLIPKEAPVKFEADKPVGECQSIRVLKSNPQPKTGMELLTKIASLVAPIMRRHQWQLPELLEFFPDNPNLLGMNVNRGRKILIRLRPQHAPDTFLDLEGQLIGTMLHELTHNVHGPHDQKFYSCLDKLQDEYDELRAKGYTGEGFLADGAKLSTAGHDTSVPLHVARQRAVEQAEKRRKTGLLMGPAGGQKLGGGPASARAGKTLREILADAAERRMRDDKQCHGDAGMADAEAAKASRDGIVVELSSSEDEDTGPPTASTSTSTASTSKASPIELDSDDSDIELISPLPTLKRKPMSPAKAPPKPKLAKKPKPAQSELRAWSCDTCTFLNPRSALACGVCEGERGLLDDEWKCVECATVNPHGRWTCSFCLGVKLSS